MKAVIGIVLILAVLMVRSAYAADDSSGSLFSLPLKLIGDNGKTAVLSDYKNRDVVLAMVYTSCRAACPLTLQRLKKIESAIGSRGKDANFVLVTLDPVHDTPEELHRYRRHNDLTSTHWHLLTGAESEIQKLSVALGISYAREPSSNEIVHSNKIFLLDRNGNISQTIEGLDGNLDPLIKRIAQ